MLKEPTLGYIEECEYWIIDRTGGSSNVYVTLTWGPMKCNVFNMADLKVARWDGSLWVDHFNGGTTGSTTAGTVRTLNPVTNFSPFTLATFETPFPVELISFNATLNGDKVDLDWATVSELNNDYFTQKKTEIGSTISSFFGSNSQEEGGEEGGEKQQQVI